MGLTATDFQIDAHYLSGALNNGINAPAIYSALLEGAGPEQTFSLYQGSGGVVASLLGVTPSGANIQIHSAPQNKLAASINEIRLAFGLTKEELAEICHVQSRKTLYNWLNGAVKPRKSAMSRIFDLLIIARAWVSSGLTVDRARLHEPVLGGQSVFALLKESEINKERILFAGSRLRMLSPAQDPLSEPFAPLNKA